ncbi:MAG: hypothetical protein QW412_02695 [Candidatus Aenigmatarchaeota archaeon]
MKIKKLRLIGTTTLAFLLLSSVVLAIPGIPHAFYGYVIINNVTAPDGTIIIAKINDLEVARTTTKGGKYGYPLGTFYIDDPDNNRVGKEIRFFVNNVDINQVYYFCNGCVTMLNLTATIPAGGSSGEKSGGVSGGSSDRTTTSTGSTEVKNQTVSQQQVCQEKWVCSEWSECINGTQTRTCVDQSNCGTNNNEPFSSQPCSSEERREEKSSQIVSEITGFFALLSNPVYALSFVLIMIIILVMILTFILSKRRK